MEPDTLASLIDRYSPALALYARQWCDVPEDVVQDAFMKLVQQRKPPDAVVAWLYRVVRNGAISAMRSSKRRARHEHLAASRAPSWFAPESDSHGLDGALVAEALGGLPLEQREVIVARLWGGLTFDEIATIMGTSIPTVHRRYHAGLATLRERFSSCPNH